MRWHLRPETCSFLRSRVPSDLTHWLSHRMLLRISSTADEVPRMMAVRVIILDRRRHGDGVRPAAGNDGERGAASALRGQHEHTFFFSGRCG